MNASRVIVTRNLAVTLKIWSGNGMKVDIKFVANILNKMKQESDKRNVLYEHGVDLINYENLYQDCLMDFLEFYTGITRDEFDWWLYEMVPKIVWLKNEEFNVELAEDFIEFNLKMMES